MKSDSANVTSAPRPLSSASLLMRMALIALVLGGIAGTFLYVGGWFAPQKLSPTVLINTFEKINGVHPGFRRNHSKGVCISGSFESNGEAAKLSKAIVFRQGRVPVIGRFAMAVGTPYSPDAAQSVRSLALLFQLPNGEEWRTGMNNIPVFPVKSAAGFYDLMQSSAPDPATGKPDSAKMAAFMGRNPEAAKALPLIMGQPMTSGFADSTYNSINAFRLIDANGSTLPVRWSLVSAQPIATNAPAAGKSDTNQFFDALITAIHTHPLQWHLILTIGQPGDSTADASVPWPTDRQRIDAGTLTIDHVESEETSPARDINFDPLILPDGIAGSDDPLLSARSAAYAKSFTRREGEPKQPSAVTAAETGK